MQPVVFIFQKESYFFPSPQLSSTVHSNLPNLPIHVRLRVAAVKRSSLGRCLLQKYKLHSPINIQKCKVTRFIYICKLLYMFLVMSPPIIRSTHNRICSIWYLSNRNCYLPLSSSNSSTIAAVSSDGLTNTRCCRYIFVCSS